MARMGVLSILCAALLGVGCGDDDSGTGGTAGSGGAAGSGGTGGAGGTGGDGGAGGSTGPATPGLYRGSMGDPDGGSGYEICLYVGDDGASLVPNIACDILDGGSAVSAAARVVNAGIPGDCSFQVAVVGEGTEISGDGDFSFDNYQPPSDPISVFTLSGTFEADMVVGIVTQSPQTEPDLEECQVGDWTATLVLE